MRWFTTALGILWVGLFAWLTVAWAGNLTVTASRANVRQGPGLTHGVIDTLPRGATFPVLKTQDGWYQIQLDDGRAAWIAASVVRLDAAGRSDTSARTLERRDTAAPRRVALVIGNAAYAHARLLRNPPNDAEAISASLGRLGFTVTRLDDAGKAELEKGLQAFKSAASGSEIALVFYAGHGMEVDQRNFLVPVDARLANADDVEYEAVSLDLVMRAVGRASGLGLVILDACRNNPFVTAMQRRGSTRAIGRGLARVEPTGGTLVAYAAKEGTEAADGEGRNSPYTTALLRYLEEPGLEVGLMFRRVHDAVLAATGGSQKPFTYGSLSSAAVYLKASSSPTPPAPTAPAADDGDSDRVRAERLAAEREFWQSIKASNNSADFTAYLEQYPGGMFEALARRRLREPKPAPLTELLAACAAHLQANRLTTGAGGTALACYQEVLAQQPGNMQALEGLAAIAERYRQWAEAAAQRADWQRARGYVQKLRQINAEHPALAVLESRLEAAARAEVERQQQAARQKQEQEARERQRLAEEQQRQEEERQRQAEQRRQQEEARREAERRRRAREPGTVFRDCDECPQMVVVPAGSFLMGSPSGEAKRDDDEGPVHRVTFDRPFAVGVYEVTFREWDACVAGGGCNGYRPGDEGWGRGDRPVINVSWDDARAYVGWLSRETGEGYRLLSESEWEYVARAGTTGPFHTGATISTDQANYDGDYVYGSGRRGVYREQTVVVGRFPPNGFGLHDVHGNVWEWVQDCWHGDYAGAPVDGGAWERGGDCSQRVVRGGSWYSSPRILRAANRYMYSTGSRRSTQGFRIARTLTP